MTRSLLIVDDVKSNREILKNILGGDYLVMEAANGQEALSIMSREFGKISAVLLDLRMPVMDGFEVLAFMRDSRTLSQLPVIVMTGQADSDTEEKALRLGAKDYISKPYKSAIVRQRILNIINLRETAATVNSLQRDRLTGLYSREAFFDRASEMVRAHAPGHYIMACFDVDKFKVINDQYGTEQGDRVLRYIAGVFREGFEPNGGICCRVAADDFAVLYPAALQNTPLLEEMRRKASLVDGLVSPIAFSIGRYLADDLSLSPSAMYDRAMIAADSIKGRYDVKIMQYDESLRDRILQVQQIVTEMAGALQTRQFEVWYQAQYNHSTGALVGAEALVRWRHPQRGLVSPGVFIPVFENTGFIYALDRYVWEEACRFLRGELDAGNSPLPVSVNISRYDVFRDDMVAVITALVEKYALPVELLRLEITESAFAESTKRIVAVVQQLIDYGFMLEIDDFGSGYSSLNTLKSVPAQVVKLDMRFLEGDGNSQRGGNIVESVVRMAKWLGMSVIAEGVEKKAQADYLRSIGCNYIQGYFYARPVPEAEYRALCAGAGKGEKLLALETVENLDNNSFWNPESMDTLIFNSYVGAACVFEYHQSRIELLRASGKFARLVGGAGMSVEDALKLDWMAHFDAPSRERLLDDLDRSLETKKEHTGEYRLVDLSGCAREVYLRSTMRVIASAGNRYLVYCTNENITAQRKAEQREHEISQQLQAVMDNVACGITAVSVDGENVNYLLANDRYYELLGYTRRQYQTEIGNRAYDTLHAADRARVTEGIKAVAARGEPATLEYRVLRRDGGILWLRSLVSMAVFDGVAGKVQLSTYTDITVRKRAEMDLESTTAQLRTMMDDIPGGFCRIRVHADGSLTPVFINGGLCRLTGMSHDEITRMYEGDAMRGVHPEDVSVVREAIGRMLENGEAHSARYRLKRGDGGYVWLSIFGRVSSGAQGDRYLSIYYSDATRQVRAEKMQKELLDNLPYGVALYEYDGRELSAIHLNKRYWELVNRSEAAYDGMDFLKVVYPDDVAVISGELRFALREGRDIACDLRILCGDGDYRAFHVVGRMLPQASGRHSIYAVYTPISDEAMSVQEMFPIALGAMMDAQKDYSFVKDKNLRYVCASREVARLVGLSGAAEMLGKCDHELFDKSLADVFSADDRYILESGESLVDHIDRLPSVGGAAHYACTSKYPLKDLQGKVVGVYGIGHDITESRVMKSRFELLANSIPGGIATYVWRNGRFDISYFSDGFCKLFDLTREAYGALSADDVFVGIFEEDLPSLRGQLDAFIENGVQVDCVYRVHLKDGGYKWINLKASSPEREDGGVSFNAVLFDVTQRQDAMERMRISEEENRLAMRHTRNAVCRYDVATRTLRIPQSAGEKFALPEKIENVPDAPIERGEISPETQGAYSAFYEGILSGSASGEAVFQHRMRGGWRWLEAHYSTIFSSAGAPVSAVISFVDITEQLEKDSAYKRWQQTFLNRAPDTYALFRCDLKNETRLDSRAGRLLDMSFESDDFSFDERTAAYADARVWDEDRDRFCAFLKIDALLSGYYQGRRIATLEYREKRPGGEYRWLRLTVDMVEHAHAADLEAYLLFEDIDRAKRQELATIEQAETDPLTGVMNRTTFAGKVNNLLQTARPNAQHALMMLDVDGFKKINDSFGHGAGDQALVDLAGALRGALRRNDLVGRLGGDEFLIFLADVPSDVIVASKARQICALTHKAFSVEVEISGSVGIVIAPRDGDSFEALYKKADAALYHVKGSGKDNYAFYHEDMADEHLVLASDSDDAPRREKKRRMLIVDDSRIDHALLTNIFANRFIVEKAKDGASALIRLRHYGAAISVMLLDLMMPGMDGFSVLKKMQDSPELRGIPVIVVSGDAHSETGLRAIREGAVDFVNKPVDPDILRVRVESAISKADNERLRAKNSALEYQNGEVTRYKIALEHSGIVVVENDWIAGSFVYDPSITSHIAGRYDDRGFWYILLSDFVAETQTVQAMQELVMKVAAARARSSEDMTVRLRTPENRWHWFRMSVYKLVNAFGLAGKIYMTFLDLGADRPTGQ